MAINSRIACARQLKLCLNCLNAGHVVNNCTSGGCKRCNQKHNSLLHREVSPTTPGSSPVNSNASSETVQTSVTCCSLGDACEILLSTAIILVEDRQGAMRECRALLDSASQSCFMTMKLCNELGLLQESINVSVHGINERNTTILTKTETTIFSRFDNFKSKLPFFVVANMTERLPLNKINSSILQIPKDVKLADPSFDTPQAIDILLGASIFWDLLLVGQIRLARGTPIMQSTRLGWILAGPIPIQCVRDTSKVLCHLSTSDLLHRQLEKFWQVEECKVTRHYSKEEQACENHFMETFTRDSDGRFIVKFPFCSSPQQLGDSREIAIKRLVAMERKFKHQPELKEQYKQFMNDYASLKHMSQVMDQGTTSESTVYLPHHAVSKSEGSSTKLRVVFDGSSKTTTGFSLNDILYVGSTLQRDLFSVVLRFRQHRYVMSADISKMYRQILIDSSQRDLQRIIWRDHPDDPMMEFRLNTVTYGLSCSPFQAIRCLQQLAYEHEERYPKASKIILEDFYVDDMLTGGDSISEVQQIRQDVVHILEQGRFELRKWKSNDLACLHDTDSESLLKSLDIGSEMKILGIGWKPDRDVLQYNVRVPVTPAVATKRVILSLISQIFHPLGLIGPSTVKAKVLGSVKLAVH